jgi:CubicO group peptidase (beta-lactamase class C family)
MVAASLPPLPPAAMTSAMHRIVPLAAALLLAGCAARPAPQPQAAAPAPVQKKELSTDLIGATAGELIQAFGQPALQVREGAGLKLQWRGRSCVLDAYLYLQGSTERVAHVDTRLASGTDTERDQCVRSLSRL